jgi:hypothetical protein
MISFFIWFCSVCTIFCYCRCIFLSGNGIHLWRLQIQRAHTRTLWPVITTYKPLIHILHTSRRIILYTWWIKHRYHVCVGIIYEHIHHIQSGIFVSDTYSHGIHSEHTFHKRWWNMSLICRKYMRDTRVYALHKCGITCIKCMTFIIFILKLYK